MLFNTKKMAERLNVAPGTLAKWRVYGQGPRYIKIGRKVAYHEADVDRWLEDQRRTSTSQAPTLGLNLQREVE